LELAGKWRLSVGLVFRFIRLAAGLALAVGLALGQLLTLLILLAEVFIPLHI